MTYKIFYFTKEDIEPIVFIVPQTELHTDVFQKTYIYYEKQGFSISEVKRAAKEVIQPHPLTGEAV